VLDIFNTEKKQTLLRQAEVKKEIVKDLEIMKGAAKRIIYSDDFKAINFNYGKLEKLLIDDCLFCDEPDPIKYAFYIQGKMLELRTFRNFITGIQRTAKETKNGNA